MIILLTTAIASTAIAADFYDTCWANMGRMDGVRGVVFDGDKELYAYGDFDSIGNVPVRAIAKWAKRGWQTALPGKAWKRVLAMALDRGGNILAAGEFDGDSTSGSRGFALWNGASWRDFDCGGGKVATMAVDASGDVVAGGAFTSIGGVAAKSIARWNGAVWSAIGTGIDSVVGRIVVDAPANAIYAVSNTNDYSQLFKWDGAWNRVSGHGLRSIDAVALSGSGDLYAVGIEPGAGARPQTYRRFRGGAWSTISSSFDFQEDASELWVDPKGFLWAIGDVHSAEGGSVWCSGATWDGQTWKRGTLPGGIKGIFTTASGRTFGIGTGVLELVDSDWHPIASPHSTSGFTAITRDGNNGMLYFAGEKAVYGWDGFLFRKIGSDLPGNVTDLGINSRGEIFASGNDNNRSNGFVQRWSGDGWSAAGTFQGNLTVDALEIGTDGKPYAVVSGEIKRWDDTGWTRIAPIINGGSPARISFDPSGNLYKTHNGDFYVKNDTGWVIPRFWSDADTQGNPGAVAVVFDGEGNGYVFARLNRVIVVMKREGTTLRKIGTLVAELPADFWCHAFDAGRNLYVGGYFDKILTAGDTVKYIKDIAKWDGASWTPLGKGIGYNTFYYGIRGIALDPANNVYVAGMFDKAGNKRCSNFSIYNAGGVDQLSVAARRQPDRAGKAPRISWRGGRFRIEGGLPADRIALYSLHGRLLRTGVDRFAADCVKSSHQPLIAAVVRGASVIASQIVIQLPANQ
jgi:hypothetical protein